MVTLDVHTLLYSAAAIFIGFQSIIFALFAKVFAITEKLIPPDRQLDRLFRFIDLEKGLLVGGTLMAVGLLASLYAFGNWGSQSFGPIDPIRTLRVVIPAVLSLILGCQITLSSFFLSILGMARK